MTGRKDGANGTVEAYDINPEKPIGSFRTAWRTAKKTANVKWSIRLVVDFGYILQIFRRIGEASVMNYPIAHVVQDFFKPD